MLNVFLISSGVLPLIMFATVLQVTSKMSSNRVPWSTFRKSASQEQMSSVLFSLFSSSSSSIPRSSNMVFMVTDCLAISTSTGKISPSDDCSLIEGIVRDRDYSLVKVNQAIIS